MAATPDRSSKRQFTPRPPRPVEERLPRLYRGLADQVDEGHLANAIKTCRKILTLDPQSETAFQTLLFLHLQTDDYTSALKLVESPAGKSLDFERAYCLYRLHREKEALSILEGLGERGRKEEHLEAQIRYRLGEYQRAQELYDGLLANLSSSSSEHPDIITNLKATTAHLDFHSHGYHSQLSAVPSDGTEKHVPTDGELESYVPSLPTGWAIGGVENVKTAAAAPAGPSKVVTKDKTEKKTRHKLPKGAVEGKAFTEDPDRWMPLRQRASYMVAMSKKKGKDLSMGTGMTQGSTTSAGGNTGGGGGNKKKKGKK